MANAKVLVSDKLSEDGLAVLRAAQHVEVDYRPGLGADELRNIIGDYEGLIVRSGTEVTAEVLDQSDTLKVVGRAGIGVDNVDLTAASRRGVVVMNTPTGNSVTTAEHAIALLLSLARNIPQAHASTSGGAWEKSRFGGREIWNKTLGIIGLGTIGRIVADRAQGLRMKVIAADPLVSAADADALGVERVDLPTLLGRSDFVTVHAPLNESTRGLLGAEQFEQMKNDALLIQASRGGIVDEAALAKAVESGIIAGAAFDVFESEPVGSDNPLLGLERVVCTPHLGASTQEAQARVAVEIAEQICDFLAHGTVAHGVNVPSVDAAAAERLAPYLDLSRKLGSFLAQLEELDIRELRVTCSGDAGRLGVTPVANAALAGFLGRSLGEHVNDIRAPFEAEQRGIEVVEVQEMSSRYAATIRVSVTGEDGLHTATGSVGTKGEARLVGLEGLEIDAVMDGISIVMRNADEPGVIGAVGTLLGDRGLNVARLQVGLDEVAGQALALWLVTSAVSEDVLTELRALEHVESVLCVSL